MQLTAELTPDNLLNNKIIWTSSNDKIATVDAEGQVLAIAEGTVTITVTAEADKTKTAQIAITVKGIEIDDAKQVSYYSFDTITDTTVKDEWGSRDGQLLGSTAKNIRKIFDYASRRECILFLDEFDVIAKLRDDKNELGELKRVVNSLIQNIDAFSNDSILIAATNHHELLDPAIWRRFTTIVSLEKPQKGEIERLLTNKGKV